MTVREFTNHLWYAQPIAIIKWKDFDSSNNDMQTINSKALMTGLNYDLRSDTYKETNNMLVDSYGVIDNVLIIEVH